VYVSEQKVDPKKLLKFINFRLGNFKTKLQINTDIEKHTQLTPILLTFKICQKI